MCVGGPTQGTCRYRRWRGRHPPVPQPTQKICCLTLTLTFYNIPAAPEAPTTLNSGLGFRFIVIFAAIGFLRESARSSHHEITSHVRPPSSTRHRVRRPHPIAGGTPQVWRGKVSLLMRKNHCHNSRQGQHSTTTEFDTLAFSESDSNNRPINKGPNQFSYCGSHNLADTAVAEHFAVNFQHYSTRIISSAIHADIITTSK